MHNFRALLTLVFLIFVFPTTAFAQLGTIQGTVTDPTGATVSNAQLTAHNVATGLERDTPTNNSGNYLFSALPAGSYRLQVQARGFKTEIIESLVLDVSTVVTRNFQLSLATGTETVCSGR